MGVVILADPAAFAPHWLATHSLLNPECTREPMITQPTSISSPPASYDGAAQSSRAIWCPKGHLLDCCLQRSSRPLSTVVTWARVWLSGWRRAGLFLVHFSEAVRLKWLSLISNGMLVRSVCDLSCGWSGRLRLVRDLGLPIFMNPGGEWLRLHLHLVLASVLGSNHSDLILR